MIRGDFNILPAARDCTADERARFRSLLDLGLTDLFRHLHAEERQFSRWAYRGGSFHRGMGLRIDLLLGTAAVVSRLRSVEIDREYRKRKDAMPRPTTRRCSRWRAHRRSVIAACPVTPDGVAFMAFDTGDADRVVLSGSAFRPRTTASLERPEPGGRRVITLAHRGHETPRFGGSLQALP